MLSLGNNTRKKTGTQMCLSFFCLFSVSTVCVCVRFCLATREKENDGYTGKISLDSIGLTKPSSKWNRKGAFFCISQSVQTNMDRKFSQISITFSSSRTKITEFIVQRRGSKQKKNTHTHIGKQMNENPFPKLF